MNILRVLFSIYCSILLTSSAFAAERALTRGITAGLKTQAAIVKAAGWTGGAKVGIVPVKDVQPGPAAVETKKEKQPPRLESFALTVLAIGKVPKQETYDKHLAVLGAARREEGHIVRQIALYDSKTTQMKNFIVRKFPGEKPLEIIVIAGVNDGGYLYLTSPDAKLTIVVYKKAFEPARPVKIEDAKADFEKELGFWKKREDRYHRRRAEAAKPEAQKD